MMVWIITGILILIKLRLLFVILKYPDNSAWQMRLLVWMIALEISVAFGWFLINQLIKIAKCIL